MKSVGRILLLLVAAGLAIALLVPNTALAFLRLEWPWLSEFLGRVELIWPGVDMTHVLAFAVLGLVGGAALPALGLRRAAAAAIVFSAATELAQFWVPGRTPLVSDFVLNVVGALLGYGTSVLGGRLFWRT